MRFVLALVLALVSCQVDAQSVMFPGPGLGVSVAAAYTGPGDVVSGALGWWGLRAYNMAYATGSNNAANIRRASDNSTTNIVILSSGAFDIATANTFAGTDATCSGSTSGSSKTIAFTGCSSTPTANDTVSGSGITQPSLIVGCGTFVAGAGSCTLNAAQNISVAETVTMQVAIYVTELNDQTGTGNNLTQGTNASQPQLLPTCSTGLPCFYFPTSATYYLTTSISQVQPFSFVLYGIRIANFTTYQNVFGSGPLIGWNNFANQMQLYCGTDTAISATDSAWHAGVGVCNGLSTTLYVDAGTNTGSGGTALSGTFSLGAARGSGSSPFQGGEIEEAGLYGSAISSGNASSLISNMQAYW